MRQITQLWVIGLLIAANVVCAGAQTSGSKGQPNDRSHKGPEMVCWGSGPDWSIQFGWWGARYLGIKEPDQDFRGHFFWNTDDSAWVWVGTNGLSETPAPKLSAVIRKASCFDSVAKKTFPYSAQVGLPQGDQVNGCCRRLKAGEAPVGPHGVPPSNSPDQ